MSITPSPAQSLLPRPRLTHHHPFFSIRCSSSMEPSLPVPSESPRHRVVVCGGGVIGVCAAYFLSKKGAAVTLVEQSSVAFAASGKAGGFLALDWCDAGPVSALARASFALHRSLAHELDGPTSYGYRPLTTLSLNITESDESPRPWDRPGRTQDTKFGVGSAAADRSLPAWVDGPARSPRPIGTTETTAQVHPLMFTRTLMAAAAERYGAEVVVAKAEMVDGDGRVKSVLLDDGRVIEADSVVLAIGPWSAKLGLISSLFRVYGLKAHSIVLEPKDPDAITPHALFLSYFSAHGGGKPMDPEVYPRPTGEVYICGMSAEEEVPESSELVAPNPDSIKVLKRVAENVSSHLREGEGRVKAEQACFLPCTDDGLPVIGELPGLKGCYVATGHSCWGILNGPATGAVLAELVLDGEAGLVDLSPFSPSRFNVGSS